MIFTPEKKIWLLSFLLMTGIAPVSASFFTSNNDTTIHAKKNLSKQQFLEKYGTDDSSKALIEFYFAKRQVSKGIFITAGAMTTVSLIYYYFFIVKSNLQIIGFFLLITLISTMYAVIILTLLGLFFLLISPRKKLLKLLISYHSGKKLPRRITHRAAFLRLLKKAKKAE